MQYSFLGNDMDRARQIHVELNTLYNQAAKPGLSWSQERALDKKITALECELQKIVGDDPQAVTPGGYYTPEGMRPATGRVYAEPALVLGAEVVEPKRKPLPWIIIALIAAGATYYTVRG